MKKLNFAIFGALMLTCLTTRALAETTIPWTKAGCESVKGTWITAHLPDDDGCDTAHCNGMNFCKSAQNMNWFSALIWCQSIGHKLVEFSSACPGSIPDVRASTCANLKGKSSGWGYTSLPRGDDKLFAITFSTGGFDYNGLRTHANAYAICEE